MSRVIVFSIFSFLVGVIFTVLTITISAPNLLVKELHSPYDFDKTVRVIESRINEKKPWKVTSVIDQNSEVVLGGAESIGKVKIIKFCHPNYSSKMLSTDDRKFMATMMPLSIAVYEKSSGEVFIALKNGQVLTKLFGGDIENIAEKVSKEVEEIMSFANFKFNIFN